MQHSSVRRCEVLVQCSKKEKAAVYKYRVSELGEFDDEPVGILALGSHSAPSMPPAPPPFMPPAQPSMARDVVIALNARYRAGHASNVLADAGVLVHVFDQLEDWGNDRGYRPCRSGWCNGHFDHESCSVINIHLPVIYPHHSSDGGVVLASSVPIACSFSGDGGTQKKTIEQLCNRTQCSPQERGLPHSQCSFGPNQLADMLRAHQSRKGGVPYNEVVVSSRTWKRGMKSVCLGASRPSSTAAGPQRPIVHSSGTSPTDEGARRW